MPCRCDATYPFFHNRVKLMNILAAWQATAEKVRSLQDDLQDGSLVNIA